MGANVSVPGKIRIGRRKKKEYNVTKDDSEIPTAVVGEEDDAVATSAENGATTNAERGASVETTEPVTPPAVNEMPDKAKEDVASEEPSDKIAAKAKDRPKPGDTVVTEVVNVQTVQSSVAGQPVEHKADVVTAIMPVDESVDVPSEPAITAADQSADVLPEQAATNSADKSEDVPSEPLIIAVEKSADIESEPAISTAVADTSADVPATIPAGQPADVISEETICSVDKSADVPSEPATGPADKSVDVPEPEASPVDKSAEVQSEPLITAADKSGEVESEPSPDDTSADAPRETVPDVVNETSPEVHGHETGESTTVDETDLAPMSEVTGENNPTSAVEKPTTAAVVDKPTETPTSGAAEPPTSGAELSPEVEPEEPEISPREKLQELIPYMFEKFPFDNVVFQGAARGRNLANVGAFRVSNVLLISGTASCHAVPCMAILVIPGVV